MMQSILGWASSESANALADAAPAFVVLIDSAE